MIGLVCGGVLAGNASLFLVWVGLENSVWNDGAY